jgi:hypothetical protein
MKHLSLIPILCAFLIGISATVFSQGTTSINKDENDDLCIAYVEDKTAVFFFPINETDEWEWYQYKSDANALEYSWEVSLKKEDGWYSFGYFLFKPPVKAPALQPRKGTLSQLLKNAQLTIFENKRTPSGGVSGHIKEELKIEGWVQEGGVVVGIRDEKTFSEIFKQMPEKVFFLIREPEAENNFQCTAAIEYKK